MGYLEVVGCEFVATGFEVLGTEMGGFFEVGGGGGGGVSVVVVVVGTGRGGVVVEVEEGEVVG
jgi:hypothetical protein